MKDYIKYDDIIESSMRSVIHTVLKKIEKEGLKGEHHFVVTFSTTHFGTSLSEAIKQRFPHEMTIVVQHQFQSLVVLDNCFKIALSFSGVLENLTIPYGAISSFADPSVNFGLKFNNIETEEDVNDANADALKTKDNSSIVSEKIVSLEEFRKNRDKK